MGQVESSRSWSSCTFISKFLSEHNGACISPPVCTNSMLYGKGAFFIYCFLNMSTNCNLVISQNCEVHSSSLWATNVFFVTLSFWCVHTNFSKSFKPQSSSMNYMSFLWHRLVFLKARLWKACYRHCSCVLEHGRTQWKERAFRQTCNLGKSILRLRFTFQKLTNHENLRTDFTGGLIIQQVWLFCLVGFYLFLA